MRCGPAAACGAGAGAVSYAEFLARPYNLVFLVAGLVGLGLLVANRWAERDLFLLHAGLLALAVTGLTLNGAIHDLRLGDPGGRFPTVAVVSTLVAIGAAILGRAARDRWFPPVEAIRFNEEGLEGTVARVVSRRVGPEPGSGRAQWHTGDGVLHLVTCHTGGEKAGFGDSVRLEAFDDDHGSYLVRPT